MDKARVKEIFLAAGFKEKQQADGSMDLNPYVYEAVKAFSDELIEEIACKVDKEDSRLMEKEDYMLTSSDCTGMMRRFKSGRGELFACNHDTKLMTSSDCRITCADCGASLDGPDS